MSDPSQMRISDADRHNVAEILREAAGAGRIEIAELDERLEATYAAKVYADLEPIIADLKPSKTPVPRPSPGPLVPATFYSSSVVIMGGHRRAGVWEIGRNYSAFALWGGMKLDLREARFTAAEVVVNATAIWAGIDIVVNQWTRVSVEGVGFMGDFSQARDRVAPELTDGSPLVRIRGLALMASVTVVRRAMPEH